MKAFAIPLGLALSVAACTVSTEEDQLENAIRENLSSRGNVTQVELTRENDDRMTGFAVVRVADGTESRLNCSAQRSTGTNFNWQCLPTVDEASLTAVENVIRADLANQGTVEEVDLQRVDDNNMRGHARLVVDGAEVRANCTATRDTTNTANFNWRCGAAEEGAPAPAAAAADPAAAGEGDK
jgi:hypothetical protein